MIKKQTKPPWLKVKMPSGKSFFKIKNLIEKNDIHTICNEALCPNVGECSGKGIATFLVLGDKCTRSCLYCNVKFGRPDDIDPSESRKVAEAVMTLQLNYVVVTSVTRDDLENGGANAFADTINHIKSISPNCKVEVLVPDFRGKAESVKEIVKAKPFVFAHNLEVTENMFNKLRPQGNYKRSLTLLRTAKTLNAGQKTKSGIMIGFGESKKDIMRAMIDLRENGVDIFTIGQYLQPSRNHYPVKKYYTPNEFKEYEETGHKLDFSLVKSGPLVRSSYMAEEILE